MYLFLCSMFRKLSPAPDRPSSRNGETIYSDNNRNIWLSNPPNGQNRERLHSNGDDKENIFLYMHFFHKGKGDMFLCIWARQGQIYWGKIYLSKIYLGKIYLSKMDSVKVCLSKIRLGKTGSNIFGQDIFG